MTDTDSGVKVTLEGFDELASMFAQADDLFKPLASKAMAISIAAIEKEIAPYPPQPDRMRSGKLNTYVRGQGRYPKNAFIPDTEEPGGFRIKKGAKAVKLTSQQMDKKFRSKVKLKSDMVQGELVNEADYSGWVIGPPEGDPHQVAFHAQTGWVDAEEAIERARPVIEDCMNTAVYDFILKLAGF